MNETHERRNVSELKQFSLLLERFFIQGYRIPTAGLAMILMAVFAGAMQAQLFYKVGESEFAYFDSNHNKKVTTNFLGLSFLVGLD